MTAAMLVCLLVFVGCIVAALAAWYRLDREAQAREAQLDARDSRPANAPAPTTRPVPTCAYRDRRRAPDVWLN